MIPRTAPNYWTHDLSPHLFEFPEHLPLIGGWEIRYYGLAYISGFIIAYLLMVLYYRRGRSPYSPEKVSDLVTFNILGVMIGGRLGYMVLYDLPAFLYDPLLFFQFWKGGMASHGGMLGVAAATLLFVRFNKQSVLHTGDLIATISAPGLFLGRIANFINGELWGQPTTVPWAVVFPLADGLPRHPSQLYEALAEGLLLFIYMQLRFWGKLGKTPPRGQLIGEFLVFYSVARMICEQFRAPDEYVTLILGMNRGQFYSISTLLAGVGFIVLARWLAARRRRSQEESDR